MFIISYKIIDLSSNYAGLNWTPHGKRKQRRPRDRWRCTAEKATDNYLEELQRRLPEMGKNGKSFPYLQGTQGKR